MTRLQLLRRRLGIEPATGMGIHFNEGIQYMDTVIATATANVPTQSGSKYIQQVCKHWSHNLAVEFTSDHGTVVFPRDSRGAEHPADALVTFDAGTDALTVRIDASSPAQLDGLKGAVARHLDRFAFREAPLPFEWS